MDLAAFSRIRLGHLPILLEPMMRRSEALGGPKIWAKRDNCKGLSTSGNKTRQTVADANIGAPDVATCAAVAADAGYVGDGYGIPTSQTIDAIRLFASTEGVLLDPVYSGKAGAGLIDYCARGVFKPGDRVCFLHTGGATSLHGYLDSFSS